jgi:hypothetical protein
MVDNKQLQEKFEEIQKYLNTFETFENYELEFRFGSFYVDRFNNTNFSSKTTNKVFFRLLNYFSKTYDYEYVQVSLKTKSSQTKPDIINENFYTNGNIRESYIVPEQKFYSTKTKINTIDITYWYTRFAISQEKTLDINDKNVQNILGTKPQSFRSKNRWSFIPTSLENPLSPFRIDLTHVTGWNIDKRGVEIPIFTYEIELELIKPIKDAHVLFNGFKFMLQLVQDSKYIISSLENNFVIDNYNKLFGKTLSGLFNVVNKPVNLRIQTLDSPNNLVLTDKADGERKLLFFVANNAYLVYPYNEISKYIIDTPEQLNNTIFDGELVKYSNYTDEYLIFDLIMYQSKDYRNECFRIRKFQLTNITNTMSFPNIKDKKYYYPDPDVRGNFYIRINEILDDIPNKKYGNDGIIINTLEADYTTGEVFKWKPPELLTIDFLIKKDDGKFLLYSKVDKSKEYILFKGTQEHPFSGSVESPDLIENQIMEMRWDYGKKTFIPFRIRYDRDQPNNHSTAVNIWKDIMNPISETTIRGRDLIMMRRYHNKFKRYLLKEYIKGKTLVDIGSGKGGDLHKWKELGINVLAVEPSREHIDEFTRRLLQTKFKTSDNVSFKFENTTIHILNEYGQNTDNIINAYNKYISTNKKASCVSIFNALTFFFENEETLNSLINTISNLLELNGYFIGMVMDGNLVRKILTNRTEISDYGWKITKKSEFTDSPYGNKIEIHLEDTIVTNQTEYLVDFDELTNKLSEKNIVLDTMYVLENKELSLSQEKLNSLYIAFVFKKVAETDKPLQADKGLQTMAEKGEKRVEKVPESQLIKYEYKKNQNQRFVSIKN